MKKILAACMLSPWLLTSCSLRKETVMPFVNLRYSGERYFPVAESDADFSFRAYVNFSTSVDRIFTISMDKTLGDHGSRLEIFRLRQKGAGEPHLKFVTGGITPRNGFDAFRDKIDSLHLMALKSEQDPVIALHEPIALFVIELKDRGRYNCFKFYAHLKNGLETRPEYVSIKDLVLKEFDFQAH